MKFMSKQPGKVFRWVITKWPHVILFMCGVYLGMLIRSLSGP